MEESKFNEILDKYCQPIQERDPKTKLNRIIIEGEDIRPDLLTYA